MKTCGQELKVTLAIHGREKTFSEQELIAILEKHFSNETKAQITTSNSVLVPTEEQWFEVNPQSINQSLFEKEREHPWQETARELILEAFAEVKRNSEKYGRKFKTMMPKKTWKEKTVKELKKLACEVGNHNADWVEQALEWAQRICNGESWEAVCNENDTANWHRLIIWKNGNIRFVGGAQLDGEFVPASTVHPYELKSYLYGIGNVVPLIVLYER